MLDPAQPRPDIATVAELLGNATRAAMVSALVGDFVMPAGELATIAGVSRPTASEHLSRLVEHGLLTVDRMGRHAYYRISSPQVAELVEALAVIAPVRQPTSLRSARLLKTLSNARTCYRHLAGRIGVELAEALCERGLVRRTPDGIEIDAERWDARKPLGLTLDAMESDGQPLIKGCVDWSERRHHLAGSAATALTDQLFALGWITRAREHKRAVVVTAEGTAGLSSEFGLHLP
ncbi:MULTISPECIES: winged helix-turn-helix domain-containing protein [Streptomyces]|uniref:Winged helix-turn-helix domain-containing protein n=1 Tax=Streptomyces yunnanensis TaxID=156453 RepID=A0ABY8AK19_9ACTN|nr:MULTISPECIES: winged helix-turn-helix domain-containing protein [Streptomyces]AJC60080.1 ArsR family transcriptional regulator [Streptomyces sp. 769]WEB43961.1 winged helix-turn-helix domain-containing protein [Streptomyces yunnanensis]